MPKKDINFNDELLAQQRNKDSIDRKQRFLFTIMA